MQPLVWVGEEKEMIKPKNCFNGTASLLLSVYSQDSKMSVRPQENNNNTKDGAFIPLPELKSSTKDPREMTYMY